MSSSAIGYSNVVQYIAEALASVSDPDQELVALVYGFDGLRRTPEEISELCQVSQPEIEQTVKSVMRRLRHPACARCIREALLSADEQIWAVLAGATGIVYRSEGLPRVRSRLPGELCFAIECQYGSVENWLVANARATRKGWYRSRFPEAEIDRLIQTLTAGAHQFLLPSPLESLARSIRVATSALGTAVRLSDSVQVYFGYVVAAPLGTRAPRAVRLHRILAGTHAGDVVPARQLLLEYRSEFADDACTLADAQRAMISFPHLILRSGDFGWAGIGAAGGKEMDASDYDVTFHRWSEERKFSEDATDRDLIRQVLEEHSPCRLQQIRGVIRRRFNREVPQTSINVHLISCEDFIRLAPGVYGRHEADVEVRPTRLLLNRGACIHYVLARWAGEPAGAYPLWTPAMENEWCEWAQAKEKQLLGSLLAVADPSSWPASDAYKAVWLWKKECLGYYRFEKPPRYPMSGASLLDLLAVVKCARMRGAANWVLVNRVTGQRILNRDAVSLMALMIGVGAVSPAPHWQRPHAVSSSGASEVEAMLCEELHQQGSLAWNGASGQALFERLANTIDRGETGWVVLSELQLLLDRLREPEPTLS